MPGLLPERMQRAPWWVWSLVVGVAFGLFRFFRALLLDDVSLVAALLLGLVSGLIFGLILGPVLSRLAKRQREAMGAADDNSARAARRAMMRGPVPEDAQVREAAARTAAFQLQQLHRQRLWGPPFWLLMIALAVWMTVTRSPWAILALIVFCGGLVYQLWMPRHLRRRLELLQQHQDSRSETESS
jgi:hypothetical protein